MKQLVLILFSFFIFSVSLSAQKVKYTKTEKKSLSTAESYVEDFNYKEALGIYTGILKVHPNDNDLILKTAYCYFQLNNLDSSIALYKKAANYYQKNNKLKDKNAQTAFYYLGLSFYRHYEPDSAKASFNTILNFSNPKKRKVIQSRIIQCNKLYQYIEHPVGLMTYKASILNSPKPDYAPIFDVTNNILYFTTRRDSVLGKVDYDGLKPEDIYFSVYKDDDFTTPQPVTELNTESYEATSSVSYDGKTMFLFNWKGKNKGDIFITHNINGKWSTPNLLPSPINSNAKELDACLSPDNQVMIFASDRKGGKGGFDLYKVTKGTNGKWTNLVSLGDMINSPGDEIAPVFSPDARTLYFSSNRIDGVGGFDVYEAKLDKNYNIVNIVNLGFPLNTVFDDIFYYPTLDSTKAFFVSKQENGDPDIYVCIRYKIEDDYLYVNGAAYDINIKELPITDKKNDEVLVNNQWVPSSGMMEDINNSVHFYNTVNDTLIDSLCKRKTNVSIEVYDAVTGNVVQTSHTNENSSFNLALDNNTSYLVKFSAPNHVYDILRIDNSNIQTFYKADLDTIIDGSVHKQNQLPFYSQNTKLNDIQKTELDILIEELKKSPEWTIDISAFSSSQPQEENQVTRQNNVIKYLTDNGIETERITTQQTTTFVPKDKVRYTIIGNNTTTTQPRNDLVTKPATSTPKNKVINEILFSIKKYQTISYNSNLDELAVYLKDNPSAVIGVYGYTDTQGDPELNEFLAKKRAEFVRDYLVEKGANPKQIVTEGRGFKKQISVNKDENGNYDWFSLVYNRRVEFEIIEPGENYNLIINRIVVPDKISTNPGQNKIYSINLYSSPTPVSFTKFDVNVIQVEWLDDTYSYIYGFYQDFDQAHAELKKLLSRYPQARVFVNNFNYKQK